MTIYPTYTCYDDVLDQQSYLVTVNPDLVDRQFIVHGICLNPENNEPFSHAWVEDDQADKVYQSGMLNEQKIWFAVEREDFYTKMQVQKRTRYTFLEALTWNYHTNSFGPWLPEYRELCRKSCN